MKILTLLATLMLSLSIDCAVLPYLTLWGIKPFITLSVVISMGIINGRFTAIMAGLFSGLILDLLVGMKFGFYGLCFIITAYFVTEIYKRGYGDNHLSSAIFSSVGYVLYSILTLIGAVLLGVKTGNIFFILIRHILPCALLTGAFALGIHFLMRTLFSLRFMRRKWLISEE